MTEHFDHCCKVPSSLEAGDTWRCRMCRRTWRCESPGTWSTDDQGGKVVSVTFRYPDDTRETFTKESA